MNIFDNSLPAGDLAAAAPETDNPTAATATQPESATTEPAAAAPETDNPQTADAATATDEPAPETDNPAAPVDWKKRYSDLRREMSKQLQAKQPQPPQPKDASAAPATDQVDPDFIAEWNKDPKGTIQRMAAEMARQQSRQLVEPLLRAEAEKSYATNMQTLAADYPDVNTETGYAPFSTTLQTIAREWGAEHLLYNPPLELMEAAAKRAFGGKGKTYLAAKEAGKRETMEQIRAKQGLAVTTTKAKIPPKTAEDELADTIVNAGKRKGFFG